ncbi:uncharacterized protein A1O5_00909 [Cladophialophora psammophila CBS 110553]|uniref:Cytochrome P450 oxidoreductase n=1 Tax=Cladophialophora psammophila CBS 110553 TaxID=1182543 RepID=W9XHJ7_9EURO|nr:uncharacterized protein A1O5_00909 [Cladophialophora psammophila CBS 110553]EXJ76401.1 hypothetical protein A1O5_00909 [Cladophialophora psammophila CBS 110553]
MTSFWETSTIPLSSKLLRFREDGDLLRILSRMTLASSINLQTSLILAVIFLSTVVLYRLYFHPLAKLPGPPLAAITGLYRTYLYYRGDWHDQVLKIHQKYGRVVRIAPNEVSAVELAAMKQLYGHGKSAKKTTWYDVWHVPNASEAFFAVQDQKKHASLRKRVSAAYSMTAILRVEQYIQSCLDLCFAKLQTQAEEGEVIDLSKWANAFSFDVVGELAFGQKLGHLEANGEDVDNLRESIRIGFMFGAVMGNIPGKTKWVMNPVFSAAVELFGGTNGLEKLKSFSHAKIAARKEARDGANREDLLSHFLKMKKVDGPEPASFGEVLIEAMNIVGAGADTTSIGIRTCLYYICTHPQVYKQLQEEVDSFYEANNLDSPITYTQTQQLTYLRAVVTEALRLLPSIVWPLLRYSPGLTIDGRYIPEGVEIGISPIAQNRDTAVFGDDASEFRPERWLESAERTSFMESGNMTFGGNGPRTCIGRNLALVEVHKFVAQMLRNFDIELANKKTPWRISSYWFCNQLDMKVLIKPRACSKI